jgi:Fe-Mn family superoxide dismutase
MASGTPLEHKSLEDVILVAKTTNNAALFNNSAQLWNHSFYWDCMAPVGETGEISSELEQGIKESFGSVAEFKKKVRRRTSYASREGERGAARLT